MDAHSRDLYASSLYMPMGIDMKSFTESRYYSYYKDSELDPYVSFLYDYVTYYNDTNTGYAKKKADLIDEIGDNIGKLITASESADYIMDEDGEGEDVPEEVTTEPKTESETSSEAEVTEE